MRKEATQNQKVNILEEWSSWGVRYVVISIMAGRQQRRIIHERALGPGEEPPIFLQSLYVSDTTDTDQKPSTQSGEKPSNDSTESPS